MTLWSWITKVISSYHECTWIQRMNLHRSSACALILHFCKIRMLSFLERSVIEIHCSPVTVFPSGNPLVQMFSAKLPRRWRTFPLETVNRLWRKIFAAMVKTGTFPYYRLFHFNTLRPIELIAACTRQSSEPEKLLFLIDRWRRRKRAELQYVSIAAAIVAAAVIGSFSWNAVSDSYWLASAFWYCSLVLSILALLTSAQQLSVLEVLDVRQNAGKPTPSKLAIRRYLPLMLTELPRPRSQPFYDEGSVGQWRPRWKMVFTWQCSIMFLSYSICFYLAGLTIFICTPLIRKQMWNTNSNTAVIYLITSGIAGAAFVFCSFWVYHYVDLEDDLEEFSETECRNVLEGLSPQSPNELR